MNLKTGALAAVAATAFLSSPALAQAAEINTGAASCIRIVPGVETLPIFGTGFTPNSTVTLRAGDRYIGATTADETGAIADSFTPPSPDDFEDNLQTFDVTATDSEGIASAPIAVPVTRIKVEFPSQSKPSKKIKWKLFGFITGRKVYVFIRKDGKTKRRVKFGTPKTPCGTMKVKKKYLPIKRYTTGTYDYYFSHEKKFAENTWYFKVSVLIYRTFKG